MRLLILIMLLFTMACGGGSGSGGLVDIIPKVSAGTPNDDIEVMDMAGYLPYKLYRTSDHGELLSQVPMDKKWRVMFSINIPDLQEGDILDVRYYHQVTNDMGYNAMNTGGVMLTSGPFEISGDNVIETGGQNCTPDMHHCQLGKSGSIQVTNPLRNYVNVIYRTGSTEAQKGDYLEVNSDHGRLEVMQYRKM